MDLSIFEKLENRWNDNIEKHISELNKELEPITNSFNNLSVRFSIWRRLNSKNIINDITLEGFLGYSEIQGEWGLVIKTLERDNKFGFVLKTDIEKLNGKNVFIKEAISEIPQILNDLDKALEQHKRDLIKAKDAAVGLKS